MKIKGIDEINILPLDKKDHQSVIYLNNLFSKYLGSLNLDMLKLLKNYCNVFYLAKLDDKVIGLIACIANGTSYDSENYNWFGKHYEKFLYIDRIVVFEPFQRHGLGKKLYEIAYRYAVEHNLNIVCAEVSITPCNHKSLNFHRSLGFMEVGIKVYESKTVLFFSKRCDEL